jgi:GntR family transcriptional regulator
MPPERHTVAAKPVYTDIADHYRTRILEGALPAGERLPTAKAVADLFDTSTATVLKAFSHLQVEGLIRTTPRGTFVADDRGLTLVGTDRLSRIRRQLPYLVDGESANFNSAGVLTPPNYVADLFDLPDGGKVLRREYTVHRGPRPLMLVVDWYPSEAAVLDPQMLATHPPARNDATAVYLAASGRVITRARDDMEARDASAREAAKLGLRTGSPVLAVVSRWEDNDGVVVYSEQVLPPKQVIGYGLAIS